MASAYFINTKGVIFICAICKCCCEKHGEKCLEETHNQNRLFSAMYNIIFIF